MGTDTRDWGHAPVEDTSGVDDEVRRLEQLVADLRKSNKRLAAVVWEVGTLRMADASPELIAAYMALTPEEKRG